MIHRGKTNLSLPPLEEHIIHITSSDDEWKVYNFVTNLFSEGDKWYSMLVRPRQGM